MRKVRKLLAIAMVSVISVVFAACASGGNAAGTDNAALTDNAAGKQQPDGKDGTLASADKSPADNNSSANDKASVKDRESERLDNIKNLYIQKLAIQEAARTIAADRLSHTSFVKAEAVEKFNITEVLIDQATGNPIISGAAKAMLSSVADKKNASDILNETLAGAAGGVEDYLTGELQGAVTDIIGVDIFSAADFINEWNNADSTPKVLLQKIVDDQQSDVARLVTFINNEQMNAADMLKVSQLIYCISVREAEINAITGGKSSADNNDYTRLRKLEGQYADVEARIKIYSQDTGGNSSGGDKKNAGILDSDKAIAELAPGNIAVNYDVKSFIEAQKSTSQTGVISKKALGDILGGLASEDMQTVESQVQEKRSMLYNTITDFMEESFSNVVSAKEQYDINRNILKLLSSGDDGMAYYTQLYAANNDYYAAYTGAREKYIAALEKYYFDLSCGYQFYACVLTDKQNSFLSQLKNEMDSVKKCVEAYDSEMQSGYTKDEKSKRYNEIMKLYIDAVDYIQIRAASLGQAPGFHAETTVNKYNGLGECHSYTNGDKITVIIRLRTGEYIYGDGAGVRCYYDTSGNPIYIHAGTDWVSFFNNEVMSYNLMNENFINDYKTSAQKTIEMFKK